MCSSQARRTFWLEEGEEGPEPVGEGSRRGQGPELQAAELR